MKQIVTYAVRIVGWQGAAAAAAVAAEGLDLWTTNARRVRAQAKVSDVRITRPLDYKHEDRVESRELASSRVVASEPTVVVVAPIHGFSRPMEHSRPNSRLVAAANLHKEAICSRAQYPVAPVAAVVVVWPRVSSTPETCRESHCLPARISIGATTFKYLELVGVAAVTA